MSLHRQRGEHVGNVVVGEHPTWLPKFGTFPLPRPDKKVDNVAIIDNLATLQEHLQLALMVELSTIPLYLYAAYSINQSQQKGKEVAGLIISVAIEEMLHLALVGNVLKAVGGTPTLYPKKGVLEYWPSYPMRMAGHSGNPGHAGPLTMNLQRANMEQIMTFLRIELPETQGALPQPDSYDTLGQFYQAVQNAMAQLLPSIPNLFNPLSSDYQFSTEDKVYSALPPGSGDLILVQDLPSANLALQTIIDQGEGMDGGPWDDPTQPPKDLELAHYYKFLSILSLPPPPLLNVPLNPHTTQYHDPKIQAVSSLVDASFCFFLLSLEQTWTISLS